jgi:outer membrane murein-binding lipoprotein Lpp
MSTSLILSSLKSDDLSKAKVEELASAIANLNSDNPDKSIQNFIYLEFLSQVIEKAKNAIKSTTIDELYKHNNSTAIALNGTVIKVKEAGVRYDFSNSQKWNDISAQEKTIAQKRKEVEDFLKTLKSKTTTLDEETGELQEFYPPIKKSTTTVEVQLSK